MLSFREFLSESAEESTSEWMSGKQLHDHLNGHAAKAVSRHEIYQTLTNHDMAHGGVGNLLHRIKTNKHGMVSVQVASTKKDKEGNTHHATFHLSTSKRRVVAGEWQKTNKAKVTRTIKRFGYED